MRFRLAWRLQKCRTPHRPINPERPDTESFAPPLELSYFIHALKCREKVKWKKKTGQEKKISSKRRRRFPVPRGRWSWIAACGVALSLVPSVDAAGGEGIWKLGDWVVDALGTQSGTSLKLPVIGSLCCIPPCI